MPQARQSAAAAAGTGGGAVQLVALTLLRIAVGWHFLYEGLAKLADPTWSAAGYLRSSDWVLAEVFRDVAAWPPALRAVDLLNVWGLILVGGALMLGLFTRFAACCAILMLALYYAAHPPLLGTRPGLGSEGHYLLVDKNLVELLALGVVALVPASRRLGVDRLLHALRRRRRSRPAEEAAPEPAFRDPMGRRAVLASLTGLPFLGAFVVTFLKRHGWQSHDEAALARRAGTPGEGVGSPESGVDAVSSATIKTFQFTSLEDRKGLVPNAKLGGLELSRVILGGNLIGGWAHARDLIYVSKLVKAYHHKWKVFETFKLAEKCGINAFLTNPVLCDVIQEYWERKLGDIQFISDCAGGDLIEQTKRSIDAGAAACYVQGGIADRLVRRGDYEPIAKALELTRRSGLPAGIGAHRIATVKGCVEQGLEPDFWMKTLHHHNYWSAKPEQKCDNIWCEHPEETIAFMEGRPEPWIAFKVLAAGAIHPKVGFRYALKHGADFICVGMYDFQIVDDVNIALDALAEARQRPRPWRA